MPNQNYFSYSVKLIENKGVKFWKILLGLVIAATGSYFLFQKELLPFWLMAAGITLLLAVYAILIAGKPFNWIDWHPLFVLIGVGIALLFTLFYYLILHLLDFFWPILPHAFSYLTVLKGQWNLTGISLLLFFIIAPCLELFWRGFIQRWAMNRWGGQIGCLLTVLFYVAVFAYSLDWLLIISAFATAVFFGIFYAWTKNIVPCIVAHSFWLALLFLFISL